MLLTMVDGAHAALGRRRRRGRAALRDLVFDARVPRSVRLAEAPSHGLPIIAYDPRSAGADAYYRVAKSWSTASGRRGSRAAGGHVESRS